MKNNLGKADKLVRFFIATFIAALWFANVISGMLAVSFLALAAVLVVTSLVGFCPWFYLLGIKPMKS